VSSIGPVTLTAIVVPVLERHLRDALIGTGEAGVVEQHVQPSEAVQGTRDQIDAVALLGDVGADDQTLAVGRGDESRRLFERLGPPGPDRDPRALARVGERKLAADARAGARDQHDAAVESSLAHRDRGATAAAASGSSRGRRRGVVAFARLRSASTRRTCGSPHLGRWRESLRRAKATTPRRRSRLA